MVKKDFRILFGSITLLVVLLDQVTKWLIESFQPDLYLRFLRIHYLTNTGAGFSILQGKTFLLGLISLAVVLVLLYYYKEIPSEKLSQTFFALFLGGAIGNMIDRFFRGYVVDFIDFGWWPAFNVADAAISVAVVGIIIVSWKK